MCKWKAPDVDYMYVKKGNHTAHLQTIFEGLLQWHVFTVVKFAILDSLNGKLTLVFWP